MKLEVMRFSSQKDDTLGLLFDVTDGRKFMCYTLEDEHRDVKVMHETRVPAGTYNLRLKTWGGFHDRYSNRFSEIHKGMIVLLTPQLVQLDSEKQLIQYLILMNLISIC